MLQATLHLPAHHPPGAAGRRNSLRRGPRDGYSLTLDDTEAFLSAPSIRVSAGIRLRALAGKLLDLALHHGLDENLAPDILSGQ